MPDETIKSFRDFASQTVSEFLYAEGFEFSEALCDGVTYLVDNIAGYSEEGVRLRPECIVTTDIDKIAKVLPTRLLVRIGSGDLSAATFHRALKACAPLAQNGWVIFFAVSTSTVTYLSLIHI